MITQKRLREVLYYNPCTGIFTWLKKHQKVRVGDIAGGVDEEGYVRIRIDGRKYRAHRLAWLYMKGRWPKQIDHVNLIKHDNSFNNLRLATNSQQQMNRAKQTNNTSGHKGVAFFKPRSTWMCTLKVRGRLKRRYFRTKEEAAIQYVAWAERYHGVYARVQ